MMTAFTYGAYSASISIVITLITYFAGIDHSPVGRYLGWIGFVVLAIMIYLAIKARREEEYSGYITYGQSVGTGTLVAISASFILAIFMFIYFSYINPEIIDYIVGQAEAGLQAKHIPPDKMAQALRFTRMFTSAPIEAIFTLVGGTIIGVILSLIIGIFTRSKIEEPLIEG